MVEPRGVFEFRLDKDGSPLGVTVNEGEMDGVVVAVEQSFGGDQPPFALVTIRVPVPFAYRGDPVRLTIFDKRDR